MMKEEVIDFVVLPNLVYIPMKELIGFVFLSVFDLVAFILVVLVLVKTVHVIQVELDFVVPPTHVHIATQRLIAIHVVLVVLVAVDLPLF